ncbi:hypothetical protein AVEN_58444-1 [Araneus ventricosus]|uniref:Uncharacterized protein n=1 Tax=Araneus ventricosus TaxID=182803 RepID=A0A4Y2NBQ5_ARAVE|nr:hypothetical protein AVEN_58444-1 [Araneus ventricosus]
MAVARLLRGEAGSVAGVQVNLKVTGALGNATTKLSQTWKSQPQGWSGGSSSHPLPFTGVSPVFGDGPCEPQHHYCTHVQEREPAYLSSPLLIHLLLVPPGGILFG